MTFSHNDFKYIDSHTHFFPPQIFEAVWKFFEQRGWSVKYKLSSDKLVHFLKNQKVEAFTTYNYAHKASIADSINEWTNAFVKQHDNAIPFGCVWPEDQDRVDYVRKILDDYNFKGIKIQLLVQDFYPNDERMSGVYDLILDRGKIINFHVGTAPYRNQHVGYNHFVKFLENYPDMTVIVAHMGAFEYKKFLNLLDKHENLYLDTTMIYIPGNIFPERKSKRPKPEDLLSYQDRILFGTDYPNIPYEYERSTKGLLEFDLPKKFYENIFYENAKRLFDI